MRRDNLKPLPLSILCSNKGWSSKVFQGISNPGILYPCKSHCRIKLFKIALLKKGYKPLRACWDDDRAAWKSCGNFNDSFFMF